MEASEDNTNTVAVAAIPQFIAYLISLTMTNQYVTTDMVIQ